MEEYKYRFKTKEEFLKEFGPDWNQQVGYGWPNPMNYLFGIDYPYILTDDRFRNNDTDELDGWEITNKMLIKKQQSPNYLPKKFDRTLEKFLTESHKTYPYRFKTEEEFEKEYGWNWRKVVRESWISPEMDEYFGKDFEYPIIERSMVQHEVPSSIVEYWSTSMEMLIKKPKVPSYLPKKFDRTLESVNESYKRYNYDSVVIEIDSIEEFKEAKKYLLGFDFHTESTFFSNVLSQVMRMNVYIRVNLYDDVERWRLTHGTMAMLEENSEGNTFEKVFKVNDLKNGLLENLKKYGKIIFYPNYEPKKFNMTFEAFHENYKYPSIVILIKNIDELKEAYDLLSNFSDVKIVYNNIISAGFDNEEQYYIRIKQNGQLSYSELEYLEVNSQDSYSTYEKLFTVKDLREGLMKQITTFGNSRLKPNYLPKKFNKTLEKNNYSTDELLLEKSSLTKLGVPREVMQPIQRDFAIQPDATWDRIRLKRDVEKIFRKGEKELIIQIELDSIKVFVSYPSSTETKYFVDTYILEDTGWAGEYKKLEREKLSITQLLYQIDSKTLLFHLKSDFSLLKQGKRQSIKKEKSFEEFTNRFKTDFLHNFNSILKRIVGSRYKDAKKEIRDKAKQIEIENQMMISGLDDPLSGPNSLTILDDFLIQFEEAYSDFFGERLDIQELSKYFTYEKIMTGFMYFIYVGKILDK